MKIGLDIMGGDYAPKATLLGVKEVLPLLSNNETLVLFGDEPTITKFFSENDIPTSNIEIVHTTEVIEMSEHPTKAITKKPDSSITRGFHYLKEGLIDTFASAGNTGAMYVGSLFSIKAIDGVLRPPLISLIPKEKGGFGILLDVGANADCKPDVLVQFGILGKLYAELVCNIENPRVALVNLGEEKEKGNLLVQATYPLMEDCTQFNFVGNIEGRDLFNDKADVMVCDGFTGNVMLKLAESFYVLTLKKKIKDEFFDRFNYEQYGGTPILGVNAPVLIGHGISSPEAIKNMLLLSRDIHNSQLTTKIKAVFSN